MSTDSKARSDVKIRTDSLKSYLEDHHAGATGGAELAASLAEHNTQYEVLATVARDITEDRDTLVRLMGQFGTEGSTVKQAGALFMEKIGASSFEGGSEANQSHTFLRQIELLRMGVHGKLCLWQTLDGISDADERLGNFNFERLAARAETQLEGLRECQIKIARKALVE